MVNRNRKQESLQPADYDARRDELADRIAAIVLADGLAALTLRGLAEKLSTSGRMLLYYFQTKDELVVATLRRVSDCLNIVLLERPRHDRLTPGTFLERALATTSDPEIAPFFRVWTEVIARGARAEQPFQQIASEIVVSWLDWIENQLVETADTSGHTRAAAILSIIEGSLLLESAHPGSATAAQRYLSQLLDNDINRHKRPSKAAIKKR